MRTLVIKEMNSAKPNPFDENGPPRVKALCVRTHDLGGTDHSVICYLTSQQAEAISGSIHKRGEQDFPAPMSILREKNRKTGARAWVLSIKGETAARLNDDEVRFIAEMGRPLFEIGQPNWETRKIEDLEDRIAALSETRDRIVEGHMNDTVSTAKNVFGTILRMTVTEGEPDIETLQQDTEALNGLIDRCRKMNLDLLSSRDDMSEVAKLMTTIALMGRDPEGSEMEIMETAHENLDWAIRSACRISGVSPVRNDAPSEPEM